MHQIPKWHLTCLQAVSAVSVPKKSTEQCNVPDGQPANFVAATHPDEISVALMCFNTALRRVADSASSLIQKFPTEMEEDKMVIEDQLKDNLLETIRDGFGNTASKVKIVSIDVDEDLMEIQIVVGIETKATPEALANKYYSLTGRVQDTLGSKWKRYFPIITPRFNRNQHA